jgi:ElaB/YqjD/DUF883 family membrane-anchored ribosome-binding protein
MTTTKEVVSEIDKKKVQAEKELSKMKKQMDSTVKKADDYVKKNPEKAALIAAGVGAALGAATAMLFAGDSKKKKK